MKSTNLSRRISAILRFCQLWHLLRAKPDSNHLSSLVSDPKKDTRSSSIYLPKAVDSNSTLNPSTDLLYRIDTTFLVGVKRLLWPPGISEGNRHFVGADNSEPAASAWRYSAVQMNADWRKEVQLTSSFQLSCSRLVFNR
ncbi:unnamed protein product [Protopolystoma xenopodis]|uniref:Uncharacterized protein n=1 Tax=Protopolystoma xenopodis TaxID=117903 RepID=A0A3S5FEH6_9PLAT|nr:unnamed protein product [Protopolystoma xenopodis]